MTREEIIKGLEVILEETADMFYRSTIQYALALLKAQEPRLLRLDEIKVLGMMWLESRNGFVQPVICQNYEYAVDRSVEFIMIHGTICNSINTFGKLWRVWTSKPTDEQRKETAWPGA